MGISLVACGKCEFPEAVSLRYPSDMDILKMLAELRQEHQQIGEAIVTLERLAQGHGRRRGRPPTWMATLKDLPKRRGRTPGSRNKARTGAKK